MWRDGFLDTAALARVPASQRYCGAGDGMPGDVARKEPLPGVSVVPVQSQDLEQPWREHYVAILTILALVHTDHHALAVELGGLQVYDFRHAQPGGVRAHQDRALLETGDRLEEGSDLLQAQDDRESEGLLRQRKVLVAPGSLERHAVEEAQCADRWTEARGGQLALFAKMDEADPDLFRAEQVRRAPAMPGRTVNQQQLG